MKRDNKKETTCWDKTEIDFFNILLKCSKSFNIDFCPKDLVFVSSQQLVVHLNQRVVFAWLLQYSSDKCDRFFIRVAHVTGFIGQVRICNSGNAGQKMFR